jgi:myxalamid-type polyketide synthase MxaE and MxaD
LLADLEENENSPSELDTQLRCATKEERHRLLQDVVKNAVGRVLKLNPSRIDSRKALGDIGLSSLMAIELRNRLETALGRPLSATLAWNHPTLEAIVGYLAEDESDAPGTVTPTSTPSGGELIDSLTAVASLSDEAVMLALLGQTADGVR